MESRIVEVKLIDVVKKGTGARKYNTFNKTLAVNLAASIKAEGLFNPILLRPNPAVVDRYIVVQGHHRLYAVKDVLKEESIEAKIAVDMDETDAEMAAIAENLWRNPLSRAEYLVALNKWFERYKEKHGEPEAPGAAGSRAAAKKRKEAKAAESGTDGQAPESKTDESADVGQEAKETPAPFEEIAAASSGKAVSTIQRELRIAKSFTPDQLEALEQMQVTQGDLTRLAKIKDAQKRGEVVNLVASGMEVEEALSRTMGAEAPAPVDGKSKEVREATERAKEEKAEDLSDDEWFAEFCGQKAELIANKDKYKADAILFRRTSEHRQILRAKSKKFIAETKKSGNGGPFYNLLNRSCNISHPKDWLLCGSCDGAGVDKESGAKCKTCYGAGYALRTEAIS